MDQKLLQIRRSHASARPTSRNPAWLHTHNDLTYVLSLLDTERERCARAPLTEGQIDEMLGEANRGFCIERDDYIKVVRDAERAHGIGAEHG